MDLLRCRLARPLLAAALVATLAGCDTTSSGDAITAPIAPAAFQIDTDAFAQTAARGTSAQTGLNFATAAARVGIVSAIVGANLALPREATRIVTQTAPTTDADGATVYASTATVLGGVYDLTLRGTPRGGDADWQLTIDPPNDPAFDLYTATTSSDGTTGAWTLVDALDRNRPASLRAEFDVREAPEITFTVPAGRDAAGSSVRYQKDGDEATFDFLQQPGNVRQTIQWNLTTGAGSITAGNWNDGQRSCWNADRNDVNCR